MDECTLYHAHNFNHHYQQQQLHQPIIHYGSPSPVPDPPPPPASVIGHQSKEMKTNSNFHTNHNSRSISTLNNTFNYYKCNCGQLAQSNRDPSNTLRRIPKKTTINANKHQHQYLNRNSGYERSNRLTDEDDSACPGLLDREFHSLHRNIPALRRSGVNTTTIRQHFYPDGGWGWIICGISFLAHVLTSGIQLSYGLLLFYVAQHLGQDVASETGWLGAASWSMSTLATPLIITFCRKKSTRLLAVFGGLVLPLGILFTSFATHLSQVSFSYGVIVGIGVAMVRESSTIMLGSYFKKRREFVEMVAMSGEGIGIALFSVILKEGVGKIGWRLGLQAITGIVSLSFFMGLLYRPASLYHPQRRAIQHLKNQRKKVKGKKSPTSDSKLLFFDLAPIKSTTVKVLILTSAISALGIYAPIFFLSFHAAGEGCDIQDLVLLQTFLGLSMAFGVVLSGTLLKKSCKCNNIFVSTQYICQISIVIIAISILFLSFVLGYRTLCVLCWIYGIGFGGFRYTFKMLALERVRAKYFTKAWGFIRGAESIPVFASVALTSFLNEYSSRYGRAGYYICSAAAAIASIAIFFIGYSSKNKETSSNIYGNGSITSQCLAAGNSDYPPDLLNRTYTSQGCPQGCSHQFTPYTTIIKPICHAQNFHHNHINQFYHQNQPQHYIPQQNAYTSNYFCNSLRRNNPVECYSAKGCNNIQRNQVGATSYKFGTGSVGATMGRRLQKSLSFANYPNTNVCSCGNQNFDTASELVLNCPSSHQRHQHHQHHHPGSFVRNYYSQSQQHLSNPSRSYSVPEGLSQSSLLCTCPPHIAESRMNLCRQRSQSLTKGLHVVEQITTSV